nr:type II toxin-antitoxin system antitoxin SocA domain-containing protein [uncultured Ligilactobacillus sp.]
MATAMNVADEIITLAKKESKPVTNLMLQKVMYFLNTLSLLKRNKPLVSDQNFEKWDYGPVIHSVYSEYSFNGANLILEPVTHQIVTVDNQGFFEIKNNDFNEEHFKNNDPSDFHFIKENLDLFLNFPSSFLVKKSHEEPQWSDKTVLDYNNELTKKYYSNYQNQFWSQYK